MLCLFYPYFEKRGLHSVASQLILSARQQAEKLTMTREYVQLLQFAGGAAIRQNAYETAEAYCKQAIDLAQSIDASDLYGAIYLDYGMVHIQKAEYAAAMDFFEEANQWAMQHKQLRLLCGIAANSGVCAYRQGLHEKSKDYYRQVLQYVADQNLRDLPLDLKDVVQFSLNGLGLIAADAWDYVQADRYYQQAMELARQVNNPERIGYLYVNLGVASFFIRAYDAAQEYFLQAKLIADYIQHDELATLVTHNQGALNSAQHRYEEAEALLKTALLQAIEIGLPWLQTRIYIALGKLYLRQGLDHKANLSFLSALKTPDRSARYHALAFYGLSLVELSSNDLIGLDDPEWASERIATMLVKFEIDRNLLRKTSRPDLEHAHKFFQHDLDGFPQMNRFRIVEGLLACASEGEMTLG
jgi:tetratricopeptide (TPR) repeat protein